MNIVVARVPGDPGVAQQNRLRGFVGNAGALGEGVRDRARSLDLDQGVDRLLLERIGGEAPELPPRGARDGAGQAVLEDPDRPLLRPRDQIVQRGNGVDLLDVSSGGNMLASTFASGSLRSNSMTNF